MRLVVAVLGGAGVRLPVAVERGGRHGLAAMRAPRICPGCKLKVPHGRRCPRCTTPRASATARGYDSAWQRTRAAYLVAHPTCEEASCRQPATDVHHLDGRGPSGPHGHDWANLEALCHPCHSRRTAIEQPGGFNR